GVRGQGSRVGGEGAPTLRTPGSRPLTPDFGGRMAVSLFLVDAFTERSFAGNPAAVCLLEKPPDATWMQQLAAEMNQAETAFVYPEHNGRLRLRWFTPAVEVDLCGPATLASAHVL